MFTKKRIIKIIKSLAIGESDSISDVGSVTRTSNDRYAVCDNGEQVNNLKFDDAVRVAVENNQ